MPVPSNISELSTTPGSNSPAGSESPATFDDYMRAFAAFIAQLRDGKADSSLAVLLAGTQTITGAKTFSLPIVGSITGNAATATNATNAAIATGPAASTTVAGIQENSTDAEAQTGTATDRTVTPDNLGATVLGMGQTFQDVKASRALSTNYTNSSGRTIFVTVSVTSTAVSVVSLLIDGSVRMFNTVPSAGQGVNVGAPIPPGSTYQVTNSAGTPLIAHWHELRA